MTVTPEALRTELTGLEARLARADNQQRPALEVRVAAIRAALGEPAPPKPSKRSAAGPETRPAAVTDETRG